VTATVSCSWNNPWAGSPTVTWLLKKPSDLYGSFPVSMPATLTETGSNTVYADVTMGAYEATSNIVTITVS
jgi:hypothetical protein